MASSEVDYAGGRNELSIFTVGDMSSTHYMSIPGVGYGNTAAKFAAPLALRPPGCAGGHVEFLFRHQRFH